MTAEPELVTVYRSMDEDAEGVGIAIRDTLLAEGIAAQLVDDTAPDVPEGTFEVRVPSADADAAEKIIAGESGDVEQGDASDNLDLETVYHGEGGTNSELEALSIKNLLESNGITAVLVGDSVLPNFAFEVRVARDQLALARQVIAEAEQAEPTD